MQEQIDKDKLHTADSSARIKAQLRAEFPGLFETPDHLPPLRWENHRMDLETGARYPPVRRLPWMSKAEMDETQAFLTDMLKRGWIEPSTVPYGAPFFSPARKRRCQIRNPRTNAPLPDQPNFGGAAWQHHKYDTSLGLYTFLFVDDILCFPRTEGDHVRHLRQVCATLKQHHLYLNFDKIEICQPEITYLGNRVGRYGI